MQVLDYKYMQETKNGGSTTDISLSTSGSFCVYSRDRPSDSPTDGHTDGHTDDIQTLISTGQKAN